MKIAKRIMIFVILVSTLVTSLAFTCAASDYTLDTDRVNYATDINVGQSIYLDLWDTIDNHVYYKLGFYTQPYLVSQCGIEFQNVSEYSAINDYTEKWLTFVYKTDVFTDDAGQISPIYSPYTDSYFTSIFVYVSIEKNGAFVKPDKVTRDIVNYKNEAQVTTEAHGISFNEAGQYDITLFIVLMDDRTGAGKHITQKQNINVVSPDDIYNLVREEAYIEGYNVGYQNGLASDEEFSFYGMITAVVNAPFTMLKEALNFEIFGINIYDTVRFLFTASLVVLVIVFIVKVVI